MGHTAGVRERLTPPWWVFLIGAIVPAMLGTAYGAAFGAWIGTVVFLVGVGLVITLLIRSAPVVAVTASGDLRAGRACLPRWAIASTECVDISDAHERLRSDPTAYLVLRPWYAKRVLMVTVGDPLDPHRHWYVSARAPEAFALALATE